MTEKLDDMIRLAREGKSTHEIAREVGSSQGYVAKSLKKVGVRTFKPSGPVRSKYLACPNCGKKPKSQRKYCEDCNPLNGKTSTSQFSHKSTKLIRAFLIRTRGNICENCRNSDWMGHPIPLQLHHKDGVFSNHSDENLSLLCPNCHSLTDNWGAKRLRSRSGRVVRDRRYSKVTG